MTQARTFLVLLLIQLLGDVVIVSSYNMAITLNLNVKKNKTGISTCDKSDCKKAAHDLLEVINLKANPCEDFYKFACGKFLNKQIPPGKIAISTVSGMHDKLAETLKSILEEGLRETKLNFAKQTKLSFHSCVDTSSIDKTDIQAMKTALVDNFGGWPLLEGDKWKEDDHDLTSLLVKLQLYKVQGLFDLVFHKMDPSINFNLPLVLDPALSFPPDFYNEGSPNANKIESLSQFILKMSLHLGQMEKTAKIEADVKEIIEFETELSQCIMAEGTVEDMQQKFISLNKLKEHFQKSFDFEIFFKSLFKEVSHDIKPNMTIATFAIPYLKCLSKLLETAPKRKLVNYLIWKVVEQSAMAMSSTANEIISTFKEAAGRPQKIIPRWRVCTDFINNHLHRAVGYLYMLRESRHTIKSKVFELIAELKSAYTKLISKQKWLSEETKEQAILKLRQMRENVAYPDDLQDQRLLDEEFKGVDFSTKTFADIFFALRFIEMKQQLNIAKVPINRDAMDFPITVINAFYDPQMNRIVFPAGILDVPYVSDTYPMYLNFGGIGTFIGHEIIHGFDDTGSQYDHAGIPIDWWKLEDRVKFANRTECFVDQYSDLVLEQINEKVNGKLTLGENIADSGGLRIAHKAYKMWLRKNGEEKQLIGLPFNSEQMFFISYARNYCQKLTPETASVDLKSDNHSPNIFRVNMPLKNLKAFSDAFQCKRKSEMSLNKRCRVW